VRPEAAQAKLIPLAALLPPEGGSASLQDNEVERFFT